MPINRLLMLKSMPIPLGHLRTCLQRGPLHSDVDHCASTTDCVPSELAESLALELTRLGCQLSCVRYVDQLIQCGRFCIT